MTKMLKKLKNFIFWTLCTINGFFLYASITQYFDDLNLRSSNYSNFEGSPWQFRHFQTYIYMDWKYTYISAFVLIAALAFRRKYPLISWFLMISGILFLFAEHIYLLLVG